jgi:GNAT superfamily N-acetyltransferase
MEIDDAACVAALSGELGYPVDAAVIALRIKKMQGSETRNAMVACSSDGIIAGWIEMEVVEHLTSDCTVLISGLIVTAEMRSHGIGKMLLQEAETWAKARGVTRMLVRSRVAREDAHRFYEREGYVRVKTSAVFEKPLCL